MHVKSRLCRLIFVQKFSEWTSGRSVCNNVRYYYMYHRICTRTESWNHYRIPKVHCMIYRKKTKWNLDVIKNKNYFANGSYLQQRVQHFRYLLCVPKNDTDVARYNVSVPQPILTVLGRNVAERVSYRNIMRLWKSVNIRRSYSVPHQCQLLEHSAQSRDTVKSFISKL